MNKSKVLKDTAVAVTYSRHFINVGIVFDITGVLYFILTFFWFEVPLIGFEIFLGIYFLFEYTLLFLASDNKLKYMKQPLAMTNFLIIIGYLAAPFWNLGILRILRVLRVVHFYQLISDTRYMAKKFIMWERVFTLIAHIFVLIFVMSEVVYVLQSDINSGITSRFDAFYFTVNAITKVGDGDQIALVGAQGKALTLLVAFLSLSVFFQLLDTVADVRKMNVEKKQGEDSDVNFEEIYSEQYCTFCDIKNRDNMRKRSA